MNREQLATALTYLIQAQDDVTNMNEKGQGFAWQTRNLIFTRNGYRNDILTAFTKLQKERDDLLAALEPFAYLADILEEGQYLTFGGVYISDQQAKAAATALAAVKGDE